MSKTALVIGGGPAGLMAAERLCEAGLDVTVTEAKPSLGRKFLMAGKSGLNLTKVEEADCFLSAYDEHRPQLEKIINTFSPVDIMEWANALGADLFTGSTGRVFPKVMKASPLLRAWLARLDQQGVSFLTRWRWGAFQDGVHVFDTPTGRQDIKADVTIYAMGGASWSKLGSDGAWAAPFVEVGHDIVPFAPANSALEIAWTPYMAKHFGQPLKGIALSSGAHISRGEAIISATGLEGGGIYSISKYVRTGAPLVIDLLPDQKRETLTAALSKPQGKKSLSNVLRTRARLDPVKIALLQEWGRPLPTEPQELARKIKSLTIPVSDFRPMDEAISTAGGVAWSSLDQTLMLKSQPSQFCAGEMIDWEAPTGGYLLTACLATGAWAGAHAARYALGAVSSIDER